MLAALAGCGGIGGSSVTPLRSLPLTAAHTVSPQCKPLTVPHHAASSSVLGLNGRRDVVELATVDHQTANYEVYWPFRRDRYHEVGIGSGAVATSLNDRREIAGWYTSNYGPIFGFILGHGVWTSYSGRKLRSGRTSVTELLGLNDGGLAVGFYAGENGGHHAFELDTLAAKFYPIRPPGAVSSEATGINDRGDVTGFMTARDGEMKSFLLRGGAYTVLSYPGSGNTQARSINRQDQLVGSFVDSSGVTHGFILTDPGSHPQWVQIDYAKASGNTVLTGIDSHDDLIGNYLDADQRSHGFYCY